MYRLLLLLLCVFGLNAQDQTGLPAVGEQRVLIYAINGADPAYAASHMLGTGPGSFDAFYRASSYNQVWFTGDVISVTIQMPSTCDLPAIAQRSDAAALALGVDLDRYNRRVYLGATYGSLPTCNFAGIGAIGRAGITPNGTPYGEIWLNGPGNWNHEMGHSLGMAHAACYSPYSEYGDFTDTMGGAAREINAAHRVQLGWLPAQTIVSSGTYTVTPLEVSGPDVKALRIAKPDTGEFYIVSLRQPVGAIDASFVAGLTCGVSIHVHGPNKDPWNPVTTRMVDATPGSSSGYLDAALCDGRSYADAANGITITQIGHSSGVAVVEVRFGAVTPPAPDPAPAPTGGKGKGRK